MPSLTSCPDTFHRCSGSRGGFGIVDLVAGGTSLSPTSEAEARREAERRYPGCEFALTTLRTAADGVELPPDAPEAVDAVVVAVCRRLDAGHCAVVACVVPVSVEGTACIPFSPRIWPDASDRLPRDRRRGN